MSKSRKRKKTKKAAPKYNENSFLKNQLRKLPIDTCYITSEWQETGQAAVIITRKHINGNYSAAIFVVNLLCEGITDTYFLINRPKHEIDELLEEEDNPCTYEIAHNIVWGAHEFADESGVKPHTDFIKTQYFLEEDTDEIEYIEIEFGRAGRPLVVISQELKKTKLIQTIEKTIGKDNFDILNVDEEHDELIDVPIDYEEFGFSSKEEMIEELLKNNSKEEVEEYFEVFFDIFEDENTIDLKNILSKYQPITALRIMETLYFIATYKASIELINFQELFGLLFFDISFESPFDIPDEKITYEPVNSDYAESEEEIEAHIQLINKLNSGKKNIDESIKELINIYPDNPAFKGLMYRNLLVKKKFRKVKKHIVKDYEQNPEYLFFKLYYGELLLKYKNYEKIHEIFNYKTRLDELYPERDIFHISEFVGFNHFFIKLKLAEGQIEKAVQYYDSLSKYYVEGNEELMAEVGELIMKAKSLFLGEFLKE